MIALALLAFLLAALCLAAGLGLIRLPDRAVRGRVRELARSAAESATTDQDEPARPTIFTRFTPESTLRRLEHQLVLAGRPEGWTRDRIVVAKPAGAIAGLLFCLLIVAGSDSTLLTLFGLGMVVLGYFVPDLLIYNQATKRQEQIQRELPDTLDQIVISIEAGVGFEAALARSAEAGAGPLAEELMRLIQDIALGMTRREAYLALAGRTSVEDLRNFAKAVVQAEEYGVSIASVVRTQAREMRIGRRARAEAKAQQVPVKILLPLIVCIFPVLFIVVMGPAVVNAFVIN